MAVADAERVSIVLTHGHKDHAAAARPLANAIGAEVFGPAGLEEVDVPIGDGDVVRTDEGELIAVATPGHTRDHLCFRMADRRALFAGDLLLGQGDTTWVAEYPGCVADYLGSLERLRTLDLDVIYPAHGPPLTDPSDALDRYEGHRRSRIDSVRAVLAERPGAGMEELLQAVYGDSVSRGMIAPARKSLEALIEYVLEREG